MSFPGILDLSQLNDGKQGYSYCTTASTSNPVSDMLLQITKSLNIPLLLFKLVKPAKLIFTRSVPEPIPYFFTISFSQSGGKLSILDAPQSVPEGLNHSLRSIFHGQILADRATEDGLYAIELRKNTTGVYYFRVVCGTNELTNLQAGKRTGPASRPSSSATLPH